MVAVLRGRDRAGIDHYLALEEAANWVTSWQTAVVPGLRQTREYRRALTWAAFPHRAPEDIERILDVVMLRQGLLDRDGYRFEALLSEAVLRYSVGGPAVMTDQIRRLIERSTDDGVEIRIVPAATQCPVGLIAGSFVLFSFPPLPTSKLQEPPVAYKEGLAGDLYMERDIEVARFSEEARQIRHVALSAVASRDLMLRISKEQR
ncbi:DUF5753 domain-containing protein [Nocardia rhamnosiphila]|uniref:DUF5753 domain-containing protein n=1 Tax=Nocardia rhamnosiphila TaxID=426716 RepID=UPI0027E2F539|nr:DUF5753 domain-containing protein [Nocardia zapadnayensis]